MNGIDEALASLMETNASICVTALRIKDERDEAVELLRESLVYSACGAQGPFKTKVREFLAKLS